MKKNNIKIEIPTLKFNSQCFICPICGWTSEPLLIKGDYAPTTKCQQCGHVGLRRIK